MDCVFRFDPMREKKKRLTCDRYGHVREQKRNLPRTPIKRVAHALAFALFIALAFVVSVTLLDEIVRVLQATEADQLSDAAAKAFTTLLFGVGALVALTN